MEVDPTPVIPAPVENMVVTEADEADNATRKSASPTQQQHHDDDHQNGTMMAVDSPPADSEAVKNGDVVTTDAAVPAVRNAAASDVDNDDDDSRAETTFSFTVEEFSKLKDATKLSPAVMVRNLPWKIMIMARPSQNERQPSQNQNRTIGVFLQCNADCESTTWSCQATAQIKLINHKLLEMEEKGLVPKGSASATSTASDSSNENNKSGNNAAPADGSAASQQQGQQPPQPPKHFTRKISHLFYSKENDWGFSQFMAWNTITDPEEGYIKDDAITIEVHVMADAPHGVQWDSKKHTGFVGLKNQGWLVRFKEEEEVEDNDDDEK